MHPVICTWGPFSIYSYGMMLAIAFVVGSALAAMEAGRRNIEPDIIFNLCFVIAISGVIGARIFYVATNLGEYLRDPLEIFMLQHGGLSWFGGLMLGAAAGIAYVRHKKLPLLKILDLMSPFVALAQSIGRIGCLLNGCCFGRESAYGLYFPVHDKVLIPTQMYSSLFLVFLFIILRILQDRPHKQGYVFFSYLALYSVGRFFIEFWRADNPAVIFNLTLFQVLSIVLFCIALFGFLSLKKS
ncbi:MAG: prolipoprotein diacylglyceryl transferase [Candidatus Omnitrophica bacterium]|nr:prolipoprotein diacylglyceryl transferase [Candidatus Omnitrophota bacterium]